jgi:hypothetical protein
MALSREEGLVFHFPVPSQYSSGITDEDWPYMRESSFELERRKQQAT